MATPPPQLRTSSVISENAPKNRNDYTKRPS